MSDAGPTSSSGAVDIRLSLPPEWPKADAVAVLAKAAVSTAFEQAELSDDVGVVACELMENAIKYGAWSSPSYLSFSLLSHDDHLEIEVSCPCDTTSTHYERLLSSLRTIERSNVRDSYLERLTQVANDHRERGGLGLLRLAHEANCALSASLADDRLHVRARLELRR